MIPNSSAALPRATLRIWSSRARTTKMRNLRASIRVRLSVAIFAMGVAVVLLLGFFKGLLPTWTTPDGRTSTLPIRRLFRW